MSEATYEKVLRRHFPFGFPTSIEAAYRFDLLAMVAEADPDPAREDVQAIRTLAHRVNRKKAAATYQPEPLRAEPLFTLGLISDALRYVALAYCRGEQPGVLAPARERAAAALGGWGHEDVARAFVRLYPPQEIVRTVPAPGELTPPTETEMEIEREARDHLKRESHGVPNRDGTDIEAILLSLTMQNPATGPLRELFDDAALQQRVPYVTFVAALEGFFEKQPPFRPLGQTLFRCLRAPMHASPHSLEGQLRYIRDHWAFFLPRHILQRMTLALDIWEEDRRLRGLGPGAIPVLEFGRGMFAAGEPEVEAFSRDRDWMSNLVLIAKNVHVWLDQLSRKHERHLRRLDDIPDEELDRLARWGFRGLWLIGLWERSRASQKIKQYTGNPEAVASAYSLLDYRIADDLGGEEAWKSLKERAWRRGIRLASDMVPNHMGIDSRWVIEHPHWFVQLDHPPYPWYTFGGGNLSDDDRAGIHIEDGYWEKRDAAVVFKRVDHRTGESRYIYHGNDGTSMPWNDTAQLNFLLPEVREAVIRTILHVARLFPIIRFDAAMTLAKRHYQRLWFPQPGDAGAIPSRAERGMSKAEFDRQMPVEFWREVVDRVAAEAPDTLLLAEAFWLMEGYFVRTLGMHRVYNSAFMNMLKMEENQKYRQTVKNVLEFSPEVLKRFVNFMNNPDERTAVEQFGKGDKYFGVCMLMVTMPGLPMFGHGQIEGFTEKYGMEYRRAYWDEPVDEHMVWRHETEIFPLMRRRNLFSGAENFALFDFVRGDGGVDENVFAYSNRAGGERALILYNNAYDRTAGTVHTSTAINTGSVDAPALVRRSLAEALGLDTSGACYYRFHDHKTGFEYIRSGREIAERGLFAHLDGYQWHAFLDWEELRDTDGRWGELERLLAGRPVPNIHVARLEMEIAAVLAPYEALLKKALLLAARPEEEPLRAEFEEDLARFLDAATAFSGEEDRRAEQARKRGKSFSECAAASLDLLLEPERALARAGAKPATSAAILAKHDWRATPGFLRSQLFSLAMRAAGRAGAPGPAEEREARLLARINEWFLGRKAFEALHDPVGDPRAARQDAMLAVMTAVWARALAAEPGGRTGGAGAYLARAFQDPSVAEFLLLHEHAGVHWLNKERLERFVQSLIPAALLTLCEEDRLKSDAIDRVLETGDRVVRTAAETGYRVAEMLRKLGDA